jgi:transposase InsO family protein
LKKDIKLLCSIASVSKSGYYQWLAYSNQPPKDYGDYLLVKEIFEKGKGKWGWRTLQMKLKTLKNTTMNHKKIKRIKNKYGLITKIRRKNPYKTIMKATQEHRTFPNILQRQFTQLIPFKVFCTDITYLFFNNRVAYLSIVKDIASGEIVGWSLSMNIDMNLVFETVKSMKSNVNIPSLKDVLIHSDQGFHYTNPQYISMIGGANMTQSMSRKGNCIDNSPMESFFGHFKDEVDYKACNSFAELLAMVKEYVEYYNTDRQQWELKKMTPVSYRNHLLLAQM